jgi:hypothetical protein
MGKGKTLGLRLSTMMMARDLHSRMPGMKGMKHD